MEDIKRGGKVSVYLPASEDFSVGMSQFNSAERALAYALRDSGLTLLKAQSPPAPSGNFKKIGTEEKMVDGQIKLVNVDC